MAEAAHSHGRAAILASSAARPRSLNPPSSTAGARPSSAERISHVEGSCSTRARAPASPSHIVGTDSSSSRSPSSRRAIVGNRVASAGASSTPDPGSLAMRTVPPRIASSRPATPERRLGSSSSGSTSRPSTRRSSTSTCCNPTSVLRYRRPSRTVRSPPSTSAQESSRERNMCSNHCGCAVPPVSSATVGASRPGGCQALQRVLPEVEKGAERADLRGTERLGQHARQQPPVLPRGADARRAGGAIRQHTPGSVRPAQQVGGVELQDRRPGAIAGEAEIAGVGVDQRRRHHSLAQQHARAVDVGQHGREQARALGQARFKRGELGGRDRQRHRIAAERVFGGVGAGQHAGDALLLERVGEPPRPLLQAALAEPGERAEQRAPVRPQPAAAVHHLIEGASRVFPPSPCGRGRGRGGRGMVVGRSGPPSPVPSHKGRGKGSSS